jgi:hypothetical protein
MGDTIYDRTLSPDFASLLERNGALRWLFHFVWGRDDLDFLVGKSGNTQWISVYRGLSRMVTVSPTAKGGIKYDAAEAYKEMDPSLFGAVTKDDIRDVSGRLEALRESIANDKKYNRYFNNEKEGFYQNKLSRAAGIRAAADSEFVVVDKEAVIGYRDAKVKQAKLGGSRQRYRDIQAKLSKIDSNPYGANLTKKALGNELDFLAVDRSGNILLIEYKHGTNTSGIYLSPLQIGLYYDIFTTHIDRDHLCESVCKMFRQKQQIGLIHSAWKMPTLSGKILPVLIISEYNSNSCAKEKFGEVLHLCRKELNQADFLAELTCYRYSKTDGLQPLSLT